MPFITDFFLKNIDEPPSRLYHYTSQAGLLGIVKTKTIWSTRIQYLNDSREFIHTLDLWKRAIDRAIESVGDKAAESRRVLNALRRGLDSTPRIPINVACFSEDGDSLSQWRGYCPTGGGFSIGFSSDQLIAACDRQSCFIAPCIYEQERQNELVGKLLEICVERCKTHRPEEGSKSWSLDVIMDFVSLAAVLKNPAFEGEREWRFVTQSLPDSHPQMGIRRGKTMLIPYFGFELAKSDEVSDLEIIVCPNSDIGLATEAANALLAINGCNGRARPSVVPFREL